MPGDPLFDRLTRALAGRYALVRELGQGGMATVYLGTDLKLGRQVAIKVLPPTTRDYLGSGRFQREVLLAAQLSHPHIVPLFEADEADGLLYYAMEYVEGESLKDRIKREGPLPLEEAILITAEVGDALQYAHEQGIIHRDIKPANILLSRGHALVADFGIAKALGESGAPTGSSLTGTGITVGTAEYMSPEQASGEKRLDARSDVYALAAVLYEMLAGEPPFTGPSVQAIVARVIADPPRPIHTIRPSLPPHIEKAFTAGLAKLAADRPPSARAFVDMLTRPTVERRRIPARRLVWVSLGTAAIAALGIWAIVRSGGPRAHPPDGMVVVPAGSYKVGGGPGRDTSTVRLDSFYVDSTEVTVAAYQRFIDSAHAEAPWKTWPRKPDEAWPVTGVLWTEADRYCQWRDPVGRLPTEEEWEAVARGPEGWRYPWGNVWAPGRANANNATDTLAPVGAFPLGRSSSGAVDLIGNAWEWTATRTVGTGGELRRVIKGGSFKNSPDNATAAYRVAVPEDRRLLWLTGFRCVRPVRPPP